MQSETWIALLDKVPPAHRGSILVVTSVGLEVTLQQVLRMEAEYLVARGRLGGTTDTGRVFFIPYDQINVVCVQKPMRAAEVRAMFGEPPGEENEEELFAAEESMAPAATPEDLPAEDLDRTQPPPEAVPPPPPPPPPEPAAPEPPKTVRLSKAELIARIRSRAQETSS